MTPSLFVDSSAWYAAADTADTSHERAVEILSGGDPLVTSDHVLIETSGLNPLGADNGPLWWAMSGLESISAVTFNSLDLQ